MSRVRWECKNCGEVIDPADIVTPQTFTSKPEVLPPAPTCPKCSTELKKMPLKSLLMAKKLTQYSNMISGKNLIVFDLDDTLTESKQLMSMDIARALADLGDTFDIAIISGCNWQQMEKQVVSSIVFANATLDSFYFLPTSGAALAVLNDPVALNPTFIYRDKLNLREKCSALTSFNLACNLYKKNGGDFLVRKEDEQVKWGEIFEDRGSQVTISMLGQAAPLEAKKEWNKVYGNKRYEIAESMRAFLLTGLTASVGGSTSIDVTRSETNKAYGIRKLSEHIKVSLNRILFVGDKLQPGGNDYSVKKLGITCIEVTGPDQTLALLKEWNDAS